MRLTHWDIHGYSIFSTNSKQVNSVARGRRIFFILFEWVVLGRGFVVAASILEGDYLEKYKHVEPVRAVRNDLAGLYESTRSVWHRFQLLRSALAQTKVQGFAEVLAAKEIEDGMSALSVWRISEIEYRSMIFRDRRIQTEGLGGLRPNTIILCWPTQWRTDLDSYTADSFIREFTIETIDTIGSSPSD